MRFCEKGPDIPDDLLWQRDAGNVVFMCGAGVSMGKANLPDFLTLADRTMDVLLVPETNRARKILDFAKASEHTELISIDQIFGELQEEYSIEDIEDAISISLRTSESTDIEYHKVICDLATTSKRGIRLITTNFDNLFSKAMQTYDIKRSEWVYPNLPKFDRKNYFSGLVYLHGKCLSKNKKGAGNLVISPSSYGSAYVLDKQVSEFIIDVTKRYTILFVGYSADDPPMRYLLEALAKSKVHIQNAYAFQKDNSQNVAEKWNRKGVTPIVFEEYDDLWETLRYWSNRAKSFEGWAEEVLQMAQNGPLNLTDWQRSQVVHLASNQKGARAIAFRKKPISSQWLYCFDPKYRYATPIPIYDSTGKSVHFDPFDVLGLSEDPTPKIESDMSVYDQRSTPPNLKNPVRELYENGSELVPKERLDLIGLWISRVFTEPNVVRWMYDKDYINPGLKRKIARTLSQHRKKASKVVQFAWSQLFRNWKNAECTTIQRMNELEYQVEKSGWSVSSVEKYQKALEPYLDRIPLRRTDAILRSYLKTRKVSDIVSVSVKSPKYDIAKQIPAIWLYRILQKDKYNLKLSIDLEEYCGAYRSASRLPSIVEDEDPNIMTFERDYGVCVAALRYLYRFDDLIDVNKRKAMEEFESWPRDDVEVFGRFRIWAAGRKGFLSDRKVVDTFLNLPGRLFWGDFHRKDLLNSMMMRWNSLSTQDIEKIKSRILFGSKNLDKGMKKIREVHSIPMLFWLKLNGCKIEFNSKEEISKIDKFDYSAIQSGYLDSDLFSDSVGGFVEKNIDYQVLLDVRVDCIIDLSVQNSSVQLDLFLENSPFEGLCQHKPIRAVAALRRKVQNNEYPREEWRKFLGRRDGSEWSERLLTFTTILLLNASDDWLEEERYAVYMWFSKVSGFYTERLAKIRNSLFCRLLDILKLSPNANESNYIRRPDKIEWVTEAINSPPGCLALALVNYQELSSPLENATLMDYWLEDSYDLLCLDGDGGRFALVCIVERLGLLHKYFPVWATENIVSKLSSPHQDTRDAFWSGLTASSLQHFENEMFCSIARSAVECMTEEYIVEVPYYDNLLRLAVSGWIRRYQGKRAIPNKDLCYILTTGPDRVRVRVLQILWNSSHPEGKENTKLNWERELKDFFTYVWPRTISAKSGASTKYMLEIIFSSDEYFRSLSRMVYPRLCEFEGGKINFGVLINEDSSILEKDVSFVIDILTKALPKTSHLKVPESQLVVDVINKRYPSLRKSKKMKKLLEKF